MKLHLRHPGESIFGYSCIDIYSDNKVIRIKNSKKLLSGHLSLYRKSLKSLKKTLFFLRYFVVHDGDSNCEEMVTSAAV